MSKDSDLRHVPVAGAPLSRPAFDPRVVKRDFPIFRNNPDVVFLDSAASAQKPQVVIDAVSRFYENDYANVHRGVYGLSQRATDKYEAARETVVQAGLRPDQINALYFTGGSTGLRLLAQQIAAVFPQARAVRGDRFASVATGLGLFAMTRNMR